jgi:hypothetical protein
MICSDALVTSRSNLNDQRPGDWAKVGTGRSVLRPYEENATAPAS